MIEAIFDAFTADTGITRYITTEFGIGLALVGVVMALFFSRLTNRDAQINSMPAMSQSQA